MLLLWENDYHFRSLYNLADIIVFGLPLAASINHFLILSGTITGQTPDDGNAGLLSFSVVFVFLHLVSGQLANRELIVTVMGFCCFS